MADQMVIDANVGAKWFLKDETDVDVADGILAALLADDLELHVPRVFTYEVCALLAKACGTRHTTTKTPRLAKDLAIQCVVRLFALPIQFAEPSVEEGTDSLGMSVDFSQTFKDMTYLRLAERLDCQFCTADTKILKANPPAFPTHRVVLLSALAQS
jgi:predicted nucleic acid-binding protein